MQRKSRVGQAVRVTWDDAWFSQNYFTDEDWPKQDGHRLESYGYLASENKEGLTLVMDVVPDGRFRDVKFIPHGMVREVKILK